MVSALAVSPEERDARFEERWQIGGSAFLGTFYDIVVDERANAFAAEFVRGKIRATVHDRETAFRLSPTQTIGCKRLTATTPKLSTPCSASQRSLLDDSEARDALQAVHPDQLEQFFSDLAEEFRSEPGVDDSVKESVDRRVEEFKQYFRRIQSLGPSGRKTALEIVETALNLGFYTATRPIFRNRNLKLQDIIRTQAAGLNQF